MNRKFYDLEPGGGGSHYLCENGVRIARFDSLAKAEAAREAFMLDQVAQAAKSMMNRTRG
jgi:hypothetical protein